MLNMIAAATCCELPVPVAAATCCELPVPVNLFVSGSKFVNSRPVRQALSRLDCDWSATKC